jgi:hypothetical protein
LNIVLVPIVAWLLSVAYTQFELSISDKDVIGKNRLRRFSPLVTAVAVYAVILASQLYLYLNKVYDPYWRECFKNVLSHDVKFIIYGLVAFAAVFSILILARWIQLRFSFRRSIILVVLVFVASVETRHVGARMWTYQSKVSQERFTLNVAKTNDASFRFLRTDYDNSVSLSPSFSVGVLENWYFDRYVRFLKKTKDQLQARRILLGVTDGRKMFFSESIEHSSVESFLNDAARYDLGIRVLSYTGDELNLQIIAPATGGYLSFIDNWDYGWKVFVDEKEADIKLLFGTFKSVRLTGGQHHVRFSYQPGYFRFPNGYFSGKGSF